jgi:hypothetical protein
MSNRSASNSHNDVALTLVQPEPAARKDPLWPLLVIILALITTAIWVGFLGWLAVELALKLWAWLPT